MFLRACACLALVGCAAAGLFGVNDVGQLVKVDMNTGRSTPFGCNLTNETFGVQDAAIDAKRSRFYMLGAKEPSNASMPLGNFTVLGWDLKTGCVVTRDETPLFHDSPDFAFSGDNLNIDDTTGDVYVTGHVKFSTHNVYRLTPGTGKLTFISTVGGNSDIIGMGSAFDSTTQQQFLQYGTPTHSTPSKSVSQRSRKFTGKRTLDVPSPTTDSGFLMYAVDVKTGTAKEVPGASEQYLETLQYDSTRGKIFSLGLVFPSQNRTLVSLDVETKQFTLVGTLSRFNMLLNDLNAIDAAAGVLYTYLQDTALGSFYLVGLSLDSGKVVSVSSDGLSPSECPLAMKFAPSIAIIV